ncbi:MAG: hypothetical protein NW206_11930 [Hyphomonadaceae bacterium]|nr:hypothetical protein [Hyphomonadaceae bacterium]
MRLWLFHPLVFFPLVLALGLLVVGASLKPQLLPRAPAETAGTADGQVLVLQGEAFNAPTDPPQQYVTVVRDFWGRPESLRIAALPNLGGPTSEERGVEILLSPETAQSLAGRRLRAYVAYRPLPLNAASALAVAAVGSGPVNWVRRRTPPQASIAQFEIVAPPDVRSISLRVLHTDPRLAFGVEIVSIRITAR